MAKVRILGVAGLLDTAFDFVSAVNDTAGTYPCPAGGSVAYSTSAGRTMTFSNCNLGSDLPVIIKSGSFNTTDAIARFYTAAGGTLLEKGTFTLHSLTYATTDSGSLGYGVDDSLTGSFFFARQTVDLSVRVSATLSFTRNGRTDEYSGIQVATNPGITTGGEVDITSATLTITSPRFAGSSLEVAGDPSTLNVVASDGSRVAGTEAAGPGVHYVVQPSASGAAMVDTTLGNSDSAVTAAITRVLN